jgi:hypothetical protein
MVLKKAVGQPGKLTNRLSIHPFHRRNRAMTTVAAPISTSNLIVRYCTFHDEPGYAIRTADRRVLFVDHDAQSVGLTHADIPFLVLLGDVNLAERQHVLDSVPGGYAAVACTRRQEVA